MRVVLFCHSLLSDWNHGNVHFLRGVAAELARRGHEVRCFEPEDAWSVRGLLGSRGEAAIAEARAAYPMIACSRYRLADLDLDEALDGAALVLVHEWNDPDLVRRVGARRARGGRFALFFHDTHHRSASDPEALARLDLSGYDGVLAFGASVAERYAQRGWARRAHVWHEAADTRVFGPRVVEQDLDLVFVGNWGDGERSEAIEAMILAPVRDLRLSALVHGVRWPPPALEALGRAGAIFGGSIANHRVPEVLARGRVTVHVPRGPYLDALPGVPTIRVFEALACGVPLVTGPFRDVEGLFTPGLDFLVANDGVAMTEHLRALLADRAHARALAEHGRRTVLARHTCAHRVDELLSIAGVA